MTYVLTHNGLMLLIRHMREWDSNNPKASGEERERERERENSSSELLEEYIKNSKR